MSEVMVLFVEHDKNWFEEQYDGLVKEFDSEFVAVYEGMTLDQDRKLNALMRGSRPRAPRPRLRQCDVGYR
ncbi:MAG: hypothetical protein QW201_02745 [Thermoproteota archaeon]